jgi:hypothetical protein
VEELVRDFESGMSPVEVCAATIRALREIGADKVYVSNLDLRWIDRLYAEITTAADA